jgi:hypothetical protein
VRDRTTRHDHLTFTPTWREPVPTAPVANPSSATTKTRSFAPRNATHPSSARLLNGPKSTVPWWKRPAASLREPPLLHRLLLLLRQTTTSRLSTHPLVRQGMIPRSPLHIRAVLLPRCDLAGPDESLLHPPSLLRLTSHWQALMLHIRLFSLHTLGHSQRLQRQDELLFHLPSICQHAILTKALPSFHTSQLLRLTLLSGLRLP